jgi:hypothetical protein
MARVKLSTGGKYKVRLFDPEARSWVTVTVDDRIPCKPGTTTPLYMSLKGNELWPVLLEKGAPSPLKQQPRRALVCVHAARAARTARVC